MGAEGATEDPDVARARALALLEAAHQFPCDYALTVIAFNREEVEAAVREAVEPTRHERVSSRGGKYVSHRFEVRVVTSTDVLEIYARVRQVEGVVTIL